MPRLPVFHAPLLFRFLVLALALALALALGGCMVGPDYRQPQVEVMNKYRFDDKTSRDIAGSVWWSNSVTRS